MKWISALCCVLACAAMAGAANWGQWRGPFFNGSTTEANLPDDWSPTRNVAWSAELPGASAATPIVWDDHVFVSSTDPARDTLCALGFDRRTGKQLWRRDVAQGVRKDSRSSFAAPSPATDGQVVVFFYGSGHLAAFDFDGQPLWKRNIQKDYGPFAFLWTFSSTPVLYDGKLFLQVLQRDVAVRGRGLTGQENESYLLALDPASGQEIYRAERPSQAVAESREAFSTPIPFEFQGRRELLIAGGDDISGHDPETGRELWRWGTWNPQRIGHWRLVPSPVAGDDIILVCAPKGDPVYALPAGGSGRLGDAAVIWDSAGNRELSADVPTPAFYDSDFFVLNDLRRTFCRVDPHTGHVKWQMDTPGREKYEASPLLADGKAYLINFDAQVAIVDADTGELIRQIDMQQERTQDRVRSSLVAAQGQLFIRTNARLYCIGR
jgi:outer membrane protein assembly factor BamB